MNLGVKSLGTEDGSAEETMTGQRMEGLNGVPELAKRMGNSWRVHKGGSGTKTDPDPRKWCLR